MNLNHFKKFGINGLYQDKKAIIGGGSNFLDTIDTNKLHGVKDKAVIIGLNYFPFKFYSDWLVNVDTWDKNFQNKLPELSNVYKALRNYKGIPDEVKNQATLLFDDENALPGKIYRGKLITGLTSAITAIHLACYFGCNEILLLGVDFTSSYSKNYLVHPERSWTNDEAQVFSSRVKELIKVYKTKVYQANPNALTMFPYMNFEEYCHGID